MLKRLRKNLGESNYGSVALELVVLILGILIAFQIDRWAESRRDRELEYDYLVRLKGDLQFEMKSMNAAIQYSDDRIAAVLLLEDASSNPSVAMERRDAVPVAMETVTWRSFPQINAFVYTELQSTGNLALIRSEFLRRELADHYSSFRHYSQVGLDLDVQHQFALLTAGILTTAELQIIEENSWNKTTSTTAAARAQQIIEELEQRQGAIDLLPGIAQHHLFNQKVMESSRSQALNIIELINSLIEDFEGQS